MCYNTVQRRQWVPLRNTIKVRISIYSHWVHTSYSAESAKSIPQSFQILYLHQSNKQTKIKQKKCTHKKKSAEKPSMLLSADWCWLANNATRNSPILTRLYASEPSPSALALAPGQVTHIFYSTRPGLLSSSPVTQKTTLVKICCPSPHSINDEDVCSSLGKTGADNNNRHWRSYTSPTVPPAAS